MDITISNVGDKSLLGSVANELYNVNIYIKAIHPSVDLVGEIELVKKHFPIVNLKVFIVGK